MSDGNGTLRAVTLGGIAAEHIAVPNPPAFVAPALSSKEHNTIKTNVIPFACWRAEDVRFEFDSSFIRPDINTEIGPLKDLIDDHTIPDQKGDLKHKPPLTVFGHADPTGNDDYNKILSGRRAQAMYAMLIRNTDLWEDLFSNPHGRDKWDPVAIRTMLATLGRPTDQNPTGAARKALFKDYMDFVCTIRDEEGLPVKDAMGETVTLKLSKVDFLSAGTDPKGKGDFQGCGEFNPNLIFSQSEQRELSKEENKPRRDAENAPNRRVVIFLFRPGIHVRPEDWPCPRAKEDGAACRKRFWSDAKDRLMPGVERREFKVSQDTFGCRFYQRLSDRSPCEGGRPPLIGLLHMQIFDGEGRTVLAGRKYKIRLSTAKKHMFSGVLNDDGILRHDFVPDGNYLLKVEGCDEETPMIVMDPSDQVPTVRYLETSSLAVFVRTTDGAPIEDATVTVTGLGDRKSDADGVADFGRVDPGEFEFRVVKEEHTPVRAALSLTQSPDLVKLSDSATGTVKVGSRKAKPEAQLDLKKPGAVIVKEIRAMLPATRTLRTTPTPGKSSLPDNILASSTKADSTPIDNVVLVRGGGDITLEAITDPVNQPVKWEIVANQSTATPPALTPEAGDTKAKVKTDKAGSFTVVASKGGSLLRWNFVLVGVDVDVQSAKVNTRNNFEDYHTRSTTTQGLAPLPASMVGGIPGVFEFNKHAWDSLLTIKLTGGGPKGDKGIDKITPRYLQNLASPEAGATYSGGARAEWRVKSTKLGQLLDCNGGTEPNVPGPEVTFVQVGNQVGPQWPVCLSPGMVKVEFPNPADRSVVTIRMGDSPASAFDSKVTKPGTADEQFAVRLVGYKQYIAAVASWSPDAPNTVVVHANCVWLADYTGKVEFPNGKNKRAVYKPDFAQCKVVNPWQLIGPASGGLDAQQAGMEIFGPTAVSENTNINVIF